MGKIASSQVAFRKRKPPRRCIRFNPERRYPTTHAPASESPGELRRESLLNGSRPVIHMRRGAAPANSRDVVNADGPGTCRRSGAVQPDRIIRLLEPRPSYMARHPLPFYSGGRRFLTPTLAVGGRFPRKVQGPVRFIEIRSANRSPRSSCAACSG